MSRVIKRSVSQAVKSGPSRRGVPLPQFIPPQLSQPVETPPSGPQWLHEIKLDGFRMAARIDNGRVQLLTRTGLDWTDKYPGAIAALENLNVKSAYLDGELCGVDDAGLPSFAHTQAATDGERRVQLVYYAFDLLHLGGDLGLGHPRQIRILHSAYDALISRIVEINAFLPDRAKSSVFTLVGMFSPIREMSNLCAQVLDLRVLLVLQVRQSEFMPLLLFLETTVQYVTEQPLN
jgi:ATP dependent DNA ligase domain